MKHYKAELYRKFLEGRLTENHIHELFRKLDEQTEKIEIMEERIEYLENENRYLRNR